MTKGNILKNASNRISTGISSGIIIVIINK